jgi:hypothetical protein
MNLTSGALLINIARRPATRIVSTTVKSTMITSIQPPVAGPTFSIIPSCSVTGDVRSTPYARMPEKMLLKMYPTYTGCPPTRRTDTSANQRSNTTWGGTLGTLEVIDKILSITDITMEHLFINLIDISTTRLQNGESPF